MKSMIKGIALVFALLLVSGCGQETLTCTKNETDQDGKSTEKITATFEENKIIKMEEYATMEFNDESTSSISYGFMKSIYDELGKNEGITTSTNLEGKKITAQVTVDFSKVSEEILSDINDDSSITKNISKQDYKKVQEDNDYTCK